jgi:hypothetical protein
MQMRGKEMVLLDRRDNCRANAKRALQTGLDRRSEVRLDSPAHFADGEQRFHAMVSRHFARS